MISQWWISGTIALLATVAGTSSPGSFRHCASGRRRLPVDRNTVLEQRHLAQVREHEKSSGSVKLALLSQMSLSIFLRATDRS